MFGIHSSNVMNEFALTTFVWRYRLTGIPAQHGLVALVESQARFLLVFSMARQTVLFEKRQDLADKINTAVSGRYRSVCVDHWQVRG